MKEPILLCAASDIPPGSMKGFNIGAQEEVLVANLDGVFYAVGNVCPHRAAGLAQGQLHDAEITCPWHEWKFDVRTGKGITNPHSSVKQYEVLLKEGKLYIRL